MPSSEFRCFVVNSRLIGTPYTLPTVYQTHSLQHSQPTLLTALTAQQPALLIALTAHTALTALTARTIDSTHSPLVCITHSPAAQHIAHRGHCEAESGAAGISQRDDSQHYEFLLEQREEIRENLQDFYDEHVSSQL